MSTQDTETPIDRPLPQSPADHPPVIQTSVNELRSRNIAIIALIGVNAIWGLSFPIMKLLNHQIDIHFAVSNESASTGLRIASVSWMIGIRFGLAFAAMLVCFPKLVWRATRDEWFAGAVIGVFFFLGLVLQVLGLVTIPASRSGFLTSLTAVFIPLFQSVILKRSPSLRVWIGVVIALIGVAFLTGLIEWTTAGIGISPDAKSRWTIGDTFTTLAAVFFSAQILLVDYYGRRLNSIGITPGMFATVMLCGLVTFSGSLPFVPENASHSWSDLAATPSFFFLLLLLGTVCSLFAFIGMNKYQPYVTAVQASIVYTTEPVFASSWASILPGWISVLTGLNVENEKISGPLIIGGFLILLANVVALWPSRRKADP